VSPGEVKVTFYIDDEGSVNRSGKEASGGVNGGVSGGVNGTDRGANGADHGADGGVNGINGGVNGVNEAQNSADWGTNGVNGGVNGTDGGVNGVNGGVNDFRKTILELMRVVPTISAQRIAAALGTTKRRVESNINAMKKAGLLERVGSDKTGHWEVRTSSSNGIKPP
jgi:hypothetical protein